MKRIGLLVILTAMFVLSSIVVVPTTAVATPKQQRVTKQGGLNEKTDYSFY